MSWLFFFISRWPTPWPTLHCYICQHALWFQPAYRWPRLELSSQFLDLLTFPLLLFRHLFPWSHLEFVNWITSENINVSFYPFSSHMLLTVCTTTVLWPYQNIVKNEMSKKITNLYILLFIDNYKPYMGFKHCPVIDLCFNIKFAFIILDTTTLWCLFSFQISYLPYFSPYPPLMMSPHAS